jgi:hypothetical protein
VHHQEQSTVGFCLCWFWNEMLLLHMTWCLKAISEAEQQLKHYHTSLSYLYLLFMFDKINMEQH